MPDLEVNSVRLSYEVHGEDGEPVVLLGGTGMPGFVWQLIRVVPGLQANGFRPVTFDGRGVGASQATPGPYTVAQLADDAAGLIDALDLAPVHLIGISQGGFVAEHLAASRPELLRTVSLLASAGTTTAYTRAWARGWRDLLATGYPVPDSVFIADLLATGLPHAVLQDDDAAVEKWAGMFAGAGGWSLPGMLAQQAACHDWLLNHDHRASWPNIAVPCLVIAFDHDLSFPPRAGRAAADLMPHGEFRTVAGVGHVNSLFDAGEQLIAVLLSFLDRYRDADNATMSG